MIRTTPRIFRGMGTPISSIRTVNAAPSQPTELGPMARRLGVRSTALRPRSVMLQRLPPGP